MSMKVWNQSRKFKCWILQKISHIIFFVLLLNENMKTSLNQDTFTWDSWHEKKLSEFKLNRCCVNGLCSLLVQFYYCGNIVVKNDFTDCCHGFSQALWPSGWPIIRSCWRVSFLWCCMVCPTRICPWLVSLLWRGSVESVDKTSTFTPMISWPSHRLNTVASKHYQCVM